MNLGQFYKKAISVGMKYDPRPQGYLRKKFARTNPYPDSLILYGDGCGEVKDLLVGIDIEVPELLLADKLRQDEGLDLVVSHHPEGRALYWLSDVMRVQTQLLKSAGVPEGLSRDLVEERMLEVERKIMAHNHMRSVDVARILNMPFVCLHTPADNMASYFVQKLMRKYKPRVLQDILDILDEVPEYKIARKETGPARILLGHPKRPVGKIFVEMTGGTEGSKEVFPKLFEKGVRTIVSMHLSEEHFKKVKDANLNVIIAGHISSDTLGLNLLLDKIDKASGEKFNIVECSGFRRVLHKEI